MKQSLDVLCWYNFYSFYIFGAQKCKLNFLGEKIFLGHFYHIEVQV